MLRTSASASASAMCVALAREVSADGEDGGHGTETKLLPFSAGARRC